MKDTTMIDLEERMKAYEGSYRTYLTKRLPMVIRLDGRSFHSYTRGLEKPFSLNLQEAMNNVMLTLCKDVQNCVLGYTQSDEISLLLVDYANINTECWFGNNLQKIVSVSAGIASSAMTIASQNIFGKIKPAVFDSRAFILSPGEVNNYFVWRQADCSRNSVSMLAQSLFSQKQLYGVSVKKQKEFCHNFGSNWEDFSSHIKFGRVATKTSKSEIRPGRTGWEILKETPIFNTPNGKGIVNSLVNV